MQKVLNSHHYQTLFQCLLTGNEVLRAVQNPGHGSVFPLPVTIETDGYFFLGVGKAIWSQCLIVIIADSDTLLAGSSLPLRQLPFNKKERGEEDRHSWKVAGLGPCSGWAAVEAERINGPHPQHMKRARKILSLIKGDRTLAAALFLGRAKLLKPSLFLFLQVAFLEKEIYPGRVSCHSFLKASKKSEKLNLWGYMATKKWNIVSTEIKLLWFWWMPKSFGRKIPMKKTTFASNKNNFLLTRRD